jgi:signal transduction histidine kinase
MLDDETPLGSALRDEARLAALWRVGLLDTAPEEVFDRLTRLARRLLGAPVALVSLVDADRQFFKSALGLPEPWATRRETPLSHSFCQHVVATGAPLRVEDARHDPLVCDNLAVPELGVVAYLGMPLATADGQVLGSLCAIDTQPRDWTAEDAAALRDLAALAMSEVSLRGLALELEAWLRDEAAARADAQGRLARTRRLEASGRLAGGVAHDLANVLQAVQSGVRAATARLDHDPETAASILALVGDAARRGGALTERLVAFAPRGEPRAERVDAAALLRRVERAASATAPDVPFRILVDVDPRLTPVLADAAELGGVLLGLAAGARDAMPEGGTLTLGAAPDEVAGGAAAHPARLRPGRYVRFSVADTGAGLGGQGRADAGAAPSAAGWPGAGADLGLALARDFAEQAGGGLARDTVAGIGTTVALWLPVADTWAANAAEADPGG